MLLSIVIPVYLGFWLINGGCYNWSLHGNRNVGNPAETSSEE